MFWIIIFVIFGIILVYLDSVMGKIVFSCIVISIGFLLLYWITKVSLLITLAKLCSVVIIVLIVVTIILAIIR